MWRCGLSVEQWNDSAVAPKSPWLKTSMNHHLWDQAEVSVCLFLYYIILIIQSFLMSLTSGHLQRDTLCHQLSVRTTKQLQFLSQTLSPLHCFLSLERPNWNMYAGTSGRRGETGWLIGDISPEGRLPAFLTEKNDWQWVFAQLADMGIQRWVSGERQNGERHARMGTTNKVIQTVSPSKLYSSKRAFEVIVDMLLSREKKWLSLKLDLNWSKWEWFKTSLVPQINGVRHHIIMISVSWTKCINYVKHGLYSASRLWTGLGSERVKSSPARHLHPGAQLHLSSDELCSSGSSTTFLGDLGFSSVPCVVVNTAWFIKA